MTHAAPDAANGASAFGTSGPGAQAADAQQGASPASERAQGERNPVRQTARHIAGRLGAIPGALPRLAAAGAARARNVRGAAHRDSAAERDAHRREAALEVAESGARADWGQVGIFSAGVAVGALIGAGAALLLAPATGFETRTRLAYKARRTGARAADRFEDLSDNARRSARRGARRVGRAATSARWAAEDAWERRRERD
jgi:hypothetical protein